MKARHLIFPAMLSAGLVLACCSDNASNADNKAPMDSPSVDSSMPAHVQDPSTAFPQPPVTGTKTDSSRSTDSAKKKGDTSKARK